MSILGIYPLHLGCVFLNLTGCIETECVKIFKEDIRGYLIAIGNINKIECVVIGSRGWPCKYRVDSVAVDKAVYDERICG